MTTIQTYKKMLAYLIDNGKAKDYAAIARKAGVKEAQISRVRNNHVKSVKEETLRQINNAYGRIFNPDWWRGDSDVMLVANLAKVDKKDEVTLHNPAQLSTAPDVGSLINALIAAKDDAIIALQARIADKDELIQEKERLISSLQQQLFDLRIPKSASSDLSSLGVTKQDPS
jgi:transcriptional regulator with XRE-family HTH domain